MAALKESLRQAEEKVRSLARDEDAKVSGYTIGIISVRDLLLSVTAQELYFGMV